MAFDLSNVMAAAKAATEGTGSGGSNYPPIIYPSNGTLTFRLLFNPKSNNVMRLLHRHKLDSGKVDCASHWKQECPVCKAIETIKNVKGLDLWTLKSKIYGIAYAQFIGVSTGYDFGGRKIPSRGDLIVLMFPWSVYKQISELIQKAGENANTLLINNEGRVFTVERKLSSDNRTEYRVDVDPYSPLFKSKDSQREFDAFLNDLPDLTETITPRDMPEGHAVKLQLESDNLIAKYLGGQTGYAPNIPNTSDTSNIHPVTINQGSDNSSVTAQNQDQNTYVSDNIQGNVGGNAVSPSQDIPQSATPQNNNNGYPDCFGQLNLKDKKCLICAHTIQCSKKAKEA